MAASKQTAIHDQIDKANTLQHFAKMLQLVSLNKVQNFIKQEFIQLFEQSLKLNDLTKMLQFIPLNKVQAFMKDIVKETSHETVNSLYYNTASINNILPDDIIQNILSFSPHSMSQKLVSKSFEKLSEKNDEIELRKARQLIKTKVSVPDFHEHYVGETWIIDPNRKQLTDKEIHLGYKGPLRHIIDGVIACNNGDKLLISEGIYDFEQYREKIRNTKDYRNNLDLAYFAIAHKSITFVGVGTVIMKKPFDEDDGGPFLCNLYFENIQFDIPPEYVVMINLKNVFMKKCKWRHRTAFEFAGNIYFEECIFVVGNYKFIHILEKCNHAMIIECKFMNEGFTVQQIPIMISNACSVETKLTIIGNVFTNSDNYLIAFEFDPESETSYHLFIKGDHMVKHNVVRALESSLYGDNSNSESGSDSGSDSDGDGNSDSSVADGNKSNSYSDSDNNFDSGSDYAEIVNPNDIHLCDWW